MTTSGHYGWPLLQMPPPSTNGVGDGGVVNSVLSSKRILGNASCGVARTDRLHLPGSELGSRVGLAPHGWAPVHWVPSAGKRPALGNHVGTVVGRGSKKEVLRAHTGRHVAAVENEHSRRDRAVCQFPAGTMRAQAHTPRTTTNADLSIAVTQRQSAPDPAPIRLLDPRPEACLKRDPRAALHG
jgi:hypothetical protein